MDWKMGVFEVHTESHEIRSLKTVCAGMEGMNVGLPAVERYQWDQPKSDAPPVEKSRRKE